MLCLMHLWMVRNRYPTNYVVMLVMTCLSGLLWGLTETVLMTTMHLQLVAASTVTFAIAALSCAVLTRDGSWCPKSRVVPVALSFGWTVGTALVVVLSMQLHVERMWESMIACGFVALLLVVLMFEARQTLIVGNPDDFMLTLVILNASMLCVVSIPFFVILYGFLYVNREEEYVVDAPADAIDQ
ncbi:Uncharacterized protein SCF082_LOCUS40692, partial [Durusdinium trenchii]